MAVTAEGALHLDDVLTTDPDLDRDLGSRDRRVERRRRGWWRNLVRPAPTSPAKSTPTGRASSEAPDGRSSAPTRGRTSSDSPRLTPRASRARRAQQPLVRQFEAACGVTALELVGDALDAVDRAGLVRARPTRYVAAWRSSTVGCRIRCEARDLDDDRRDHDRLTVRCDDINETVGGIRDPSRQPPLPMRLVPSTQPSSCTRRVSDRPAITRLARELGPGPAPSGRSRRNRVSAQASCKRWPCQPSTT